MPSLATLLHLRSAIVMLLKAIDRAALEAYGWTPRGKAALDGTCYTEGQVVEQAR